MQGKKRSCKYLHWCWGIFFFNVINVETTCNHFFSFTYQLGNLKPETEITWSKDSIEIAEDDEDAKKIERKDGDMTFNIGKVSPLDGGHVL